jgi:hypothetical protein
MQHLLQEAVYTKFPPVILAYLIQQHLAPRVIQTGNFCSDPVHVFRSILAGCKSSVALTRVYLKKSLTLICNKHSDANTNCFVDDTNMHAVGASHDETLDIVIPAVTLFGEQASLMGLGLSPKASIVASHDGLAVSAQKELATYGMTFQVERESRDLGISHAGGNRRPFKLLNTRYRKRVNKNLKIKSIAKITRKARKLYTGSGYSSSTWGHQACGFSDTMIINLERDALNSTGIKQAGRCRAVALIVAFGIQGNPRARLVRETVKAWFELLRMVDSRTMGELKIAWARATDHLQHTYAQNKNVQSNIIGVMSNVIAILIKAKWFPKALHVWQDEHGSSWVMSGAKVSPDIVANAINRSYTNLEMYRAASHYNGKGLSEGMHYNATMANLRGLTDKQYDIKCILETIMSAATWPAERVNNAFPAVPCCCTRCGADIEDALHCFWTCPANSNLIEDSVQDTQYLIGAAVAKCRDAPCLWLRGLLPSTYICIPPEDEPCNHSSLTWINAVPGVSRLPGPPGPENNVCINSGTYYGDASGG